MTKEESWLFSEPLIPDQLPEDLSFTINADNVAERFSQMRSMMETQQVYRGAINEITTKLETLDAEFRVRYEHNPIHHIVSRLKSPQSIMGKLKRRNLPLSIEVAREELLDIAGVRVICNYIEDIYDIAEMLERQSDVESIRRRDYIAHPKENGYRSLHLIVRVPVYLSDRTEHVPVEVQIRTIAMDFWASLEHELRYKAPTEETDYVRARLTDCARISADLDLEMQAIRNQCLGGGENTTKAIS